MKCSVFFVAVLSIGPGQAWGRSPLPSASLRVTSPEQHSDLPATVSFELSLANYGLSLSEAEIVAGLQLWDLNQRAQVPVDVIMPQDLSREIIRVTPRAPLNEGREYGLRIEPIDGLSTRYSGYGGEFGQKGRHGELGSYFVGSRPRVWEIILKGSKSLYLNFSEPVRMRSLADAVSLANVVTGVEIHAQSSPVDLAVRDPSLSLDGSTLDVAVEHVLRISQTVVSEVGAPLDGDFSGSGGADFAITLSPYELDLFVNGYAREQELELACNNNMDWWDSEDQLPKADLSVDCKPHRFLPPNGLPDSGDRAGCSVLGHGNSLWRATLSLFVLFAWNRRKHPQGTPGEMPGDPGC